MSATTQKKYNFFEPLIIGLFLLLLFVSPLLFRSSEALVDWDDIFRLWRDNSPLLLLFVINRFFFVPKLLFRNKRVLYFTGVAGLIVIIAFSSYLVNSPKKPHAMKDLPFTDRYHRPLPPPPEHKDFRPPHPGNNQSSRMPPFTNLLILSVLVVGFDTGLRTSTKWATTEKEKIKLAKEKVESQLAFLQNQVSPHFFMNTLNNIHALVDIDTEEAKEAIIKLSRMMDYMLYESQTAVVSLKQEIDFISSYVDLMKLRFTDDIDIKFDLPEILSLIKIPPLLTISFIENAFKHGVSYEKPSFVHICMETNEKQFSFSVNNSLHPIKEKRKNSGIGIKNVRSRLQLIYGDNYELSIDDNNETKFEVKLNIPV